MRLLVWVLLPYVSRWLRAQEAYILRVGMPLDERGLLTAARLGVRHPERVRLLPVKIVPLPGGGPLRVLSRWVGMPAELTAGLTAQYGIFIRQDCWGDPRLLAHELTHTRQYERLGGVKPFLRQYLWECLTCGYAGSPLEHEAVEAAAS